MMLATEAEGKWTINDTGIPHHAYTGFQYPVIRYDRTWITYDEDCPPGCMFLFHTPSWVYELSPDYNFTIDGKWVEKDLTEEGGGHYIWALLNPQSAIGRSNHAIRITSPAARTALTNNSRKP